MRSLSYTPLCLLMIVFTWSALPAAQVAASQGGASTDTLPGGASSLQETHGDWSVICARPSGKKVCTFSQGQMDKDSRQRVMAIELNAASTSRAEGTLLLPFGLAVTREVMLQLGQTALGPPLSFRTCVPAGCVVALIFDAKIITELRKAEALTITTTADGGQPVVFRVSLKGFSTALDRTAVLSKP